MDIAIIKLGTSSVWQDGVLSRTMDACAELLSAGIRVLIVSSGAIEGGRRCLAKSRDICRNMAQKSYSKPALAGFGTVELLMHWVRAMAPYHLTPVPVLVTHRNLTDSDERRSIQSLMNEVLRGNHGIIVANENDAVSHEEINRWEQGLGENDKLTEALVRLLKEIPDVRIRGVYFGTKIGGYYAPFPFDATTRLVPEIAVHDVPPQQLLAFVHPAFSSDSEIRNDMIPKLCAAAVCVRHGVEHVGIGKAYNVADFFLRPALFRGTRVTDTNPEK